MPDGLRKGDDATGLTVTTAQNSNHLTWFFALIILYFNKNENKPLHFLYPSNIIGIKLVGNKIIGYNLNR